MISRLVKFVNLSEQDLPKRIFLYNGMAYFCIIGPGDI